MAAKDVDVWSRWRLMSRFCWMVAMRYTTYNIRWLCAVRVFRIAHRGFAELAPYLLALACCAMHGAAN
jgi:hypothetical protein